MKCARIQQQLNLIEGLIAHSLLSSKTGNNALRQLLPLFKQHQKLIKDLRALSDTSKKAQKQGKPNDSNVTVNLSVNAAKLKQMCTQPENIWDLAIIEKLLHVLHEWVIIYITILNIYYISNYLTHLAIIYHLQV